MLSLENISFAYKSKGFFKTRSEAVLKNVNLELKKQEHLAIMGKSGSGKSTLAKIIALLLRPTPDEEGRLGEVRFENQRVNLHSRTEKRRFYQQVQILFQDCVGSLNPHFSVFENLSEPLIYLYNMPKSERTRHIEESLQSFSLKKDILHLSPLCLSGGEAQRVCLLRALLVQPRLLVLDESLSGLDYELSLEMIALLKQQDKAIIFITHDAEMAQRMCGKNVKIMENGRVI